MIDYLESVNQLDAPSIRVSKILLASYSVNDNIK